MKKFSHLLLGAVLLPFFTLAQKQPSPEYFIGLVKKNAERIGLNKTDLRNIRISDAYYDSHSRAFMVYLQQTYKSVDINNAISTLAFKNETLAAGKFKKYTGIERSAMNLSAIPVITASDCVQKAATAVGITYSSSFRLPLKQSADSRHLNFPGSDKLFNNIIADLKWVAIDDDEKNFKLCWNIFLHTNKDNAAWIISVDALSGAIISKKNLTVYETGTQTNRPKHIYVYEDNQPEKTNITDKADETTSITSGNYKVIPYPAESPVVAAGAPTVVSDPWTAFPNANATTLKWNADASTDYTISRGNNVITSEDLRNKNNQLGIKASSSTAAPNLNFLQNPNYNKAAVSDSNQQFSLTNLFYWNNILHDMLYQYGFDEVSGNFQSTNFSRGGKEDDYVDADGQDGYSMDNANFSTPPDGLKPRMQMFLWSRPATLETLKGNAPTDYIGLIPAKTSVINVKAEAAPITSDVVLYKTDTSGYTGCVTPSNANEILGKIAYVERGDCNFSIKVKNAQSAGATGVIVGDNRPAAQSFLVTMTDSTRANDGSYVFDSTVVIPSVFITSDEATRLKNHLLAGEKVNVTLTSINLDGSLDNVIVSHEFGHGVSNRLTGGPSSTSCLQNKEQGGEGISDYIALMMTTDWKKALITDGLKPRAIGNYVVGADSTGPGIRLFPYSTSLSIDPWTYDSLTTIDGEAHTVGEIWCTMLWEMTWAVIEQVGTINKNFADANGMGGNSIAMNLFMEGLKLQPCGPTFMDARNAILNADTLLYDGTYSASIWKAFARRGLGFSADEGTANNLKDNIAAYDLPVALPIIFGSFTAEKQDNTGLLKWTTLSESNSDKFIVERSVDGVNFTSIGEVKAAGFSSTEKSYQLIDRYPYKSINIYRVKGFDTNGNIYVSNSDSLNFSDLSFDIKVIPNPATDYVTIYMPGSNQSATIRLISSVGQVISTYNTNSNTLSINVSTLAAGVYNIVITGTNYSKKYKLVIQ